MSKLSTWKIGDTFASGSIPKNWKIVPIGAFLRNKSIKNTVGEINLSVYRDFGVIIRDSRDDNHNRVSEDTSNYKLVEPGDFVLNKMKCWMGSLGVSQYRGIVSPSYIVLKPTQEMYARYFQYLLRSESYRQIYESLSYGVRIGQWELKFHDFKTIPALYPPISEQKQITRFLDKKTTWIDSLIEKLERKIELLKEYRTALINQCVTRGLDSNIEMKDSGIEWIGEIPKHWEIPPLKYVVKYNEEVLSEDTDPNYQFWYIEISDVDQFTGVGEGKKITFSEAPSRARRIVRKGDVIISTVRTYLKAVGYIRTSRKNIVVSTGFCVLRTTSKLISSYLSYFVLSDQFISAVVANSDGVSYPAINSVDLVDIKSLVPPFQEQISISQFLDRKTSKIDSLIGRLEQKITLQKEYRQSLISNVVTGKVRVTEDDK